MCTQKELPEGHSRSEWEHFIDEWIFNEIDRYILRRKLLDGLTYDEITEELNAPRYRIEMRQVMRRGSAARKRLLQCADNAQP